MSQEQLKITPEMVKNAQNIRCEDCGNVTFVEKLIVKKISAILSSSGNEEVLPMPIIVCDKCGKVSSIFDPNDLVPNELKTKKVIVKEESNLKIV